MGIYRSTALIFVLFGCSAQAASQSESRNTGSMGASSSATTTITLIIPPRPELSDKKPKQPSELPESAAVGTEEDKVINPVENNN